ncbi:MAG: Glycogen synthase [Methanosaeta sp. PtaB.Bin039]|nr:MAG: Glycogen synthase [Methanosaeta sp. PtaB.Bin039]
MIQRWLVIAGEEGGPKSNKMGGIWNVMDAEARTLAQLKAQGKVDEDLRILVVGPHYPNDGSDWNRGKRRVTDASSFEPLAMGPDLEFALDMLKRQGISAVTGQLSADGVPIGYLLFDTHYYETATIMRNGQKITLNNAIKSEAWELVGLDSMHFERLPNGPEFTHYLGLSYAISEFVRALLRAGEEPAERFADQAISEFARSVLPKVQVSLHCHEFGVFYAAARLKALGSPVRTMATFHATVPGRSAGYRTLEKIARGEKEWEPNVPVNFATLESLARYADVATFVGDSTMKEAMLFYDIKGIVIRNGIEMGAEGINWARKAACLSKIQKFLATHLGRLYDGETIDPESILPIFTISRIEIENKGYPQLLDALIMHDHILKHRMSGQRFAEKTRVVCFLITSHGHKDRDRLPNGFPLRLTPELLVWEEGRLYQMILERKLEPSLLVTGKRVAAAALYPQWVGPDDGGLNMTAEEIMAGCIAGVFPSQYEPFLLTGLEAGREGTPSIVSRACGFSDALGKIKRLVTGMGGVVVVDNIDSTYMETIIDYALAMDYFTWTYLDDQVKYRLLCEESMALARMMDWKEPVMEYYKNLVM